MLRDNIDVCLLQAAHQLQRNIHRNRHREFLFPNWCRAVDLELIALRSYVKNSGKSPPKWGCA